MNYSAGNFEEEFTSFPRKKTGGWETKHLQLGGSVLGSTLSPSTGNLACSNYDESGCSRLIVPREGNPLELVFTADREIFCGDVCAH